MNVTVLKPVFAEAASQLVATTNTFPGTVLLKKEHWVVDAKSLLGILALSLQPGQEVEIESEENPEAIEAILSIGLFEEKK
ncbi:HPr family phosphocarrier protein [Bacillus salitolerans]|uniref:HPr family phosphocarrier protein n=1 Tax=Bacillus salitolerans TaxID=1437434 RepID=A0ABW4LUL3_9BACI